MESRFPDPANFVLHQNFDYQAYLKTLQQHFSTGNSTIDVAILISLFVFVSTVRRHLHLWNLLLLWPRWLGRRHRGEIEFYIEQINHVHNCFTPTYRAIMHKLGTVGNEYIWRFKEKSLEWYDNTEGKSMKESLYQVLQTEPIKVTPDIWCRCEEKTEDRQNAQGNRLMNITTYKVCVYSKTINVFQLQKIVDEWLKEYKEFKKSQLHDKQMIFVVRFPEASIYRDEDENGATNEDIQFSTFNTFRSFENLFFSTKQIVLQDIDFFIHEKEWHRKRGLPDSLGILCYGVPGCGKTSFIKALLKKTKRHGVIFSVNHSTRLESIEKLMRSETLCDFPIPQDQRVYILEDIDAMGDLVTKRNKPDDKPKKDDDCAKAMDFSEKDDYFERQIFKWLKYGMVKSSDHHLGFFLNLLDGLVETPGRIIVMTTNHIEKLDPALIRPGRIDISIEFVRCSRPVIKEMLSHFYLMDPETWDLHSIVLDGEITGAELTQICRANKFDFVGALRDLWIWMDNRRSEFTKADEQNEQQIQAALTSGNFVALRNPSEPFCIPQVQGTHGTSDNESSNVAAGRDLGGTEQTCITRDSKIEMSENEAYGPAITTTVSARTEWTATTTDKASSIEEDVQPTQPLTPPGPTAAESGSAPEFRTQAQHLPASPHHAVDAITPPKPSELSARTSPGTGDSGPAELSEDIYQFERQ